MTEYLLKSDVMASYNTSRRHAIGIKPLLDNLITYTFPDPSLAVDGDLISRKGLKDEILSQYPEITVEWDAAFNALLRIIEAMPSISPAPSVAPPESDTSKLLEMIDVYESMGRGDVDILREIARLLAARGDK